MSEAVIDAPAAPAAVDAAVDAAPAIQAAPITPAPHQIPGLLGRPPVGMTPAPAPAAAPATPDPVSAAPSPSDPALPTPYFATLIEKNPELKDYEKTLARFDDTDAEKYVPKLAKSYAELTKYKGVLVPGVEATPEDIARYRKVNGIPDEAKDYKLGETLGEQFKSMGIEDPKMIAKYEDGFHKLNFTQGQIKGLLDVHGPVVQELVASQSGASEKAQAANVEALKGELGDRFDSILGDAQKLHEVAFAGVKLTDAEQKDLDALTKSTAYVKMMAAISQRIPKESAVHRGQDAVFQSAQTQFAAMKADIMKNPKHPFNDHTNPDHHKALAEFSRLQNDGKGWI